MNKIKHLALIYIFIFIIFSGINFTMFIDGIVYANSYGTGFEDGTLNNPYSNSFLNCVKIDTDGEFECDNTVIRTGSKSFKVEESHGFWNYSYPSDKYITSWTTYLYKDFGNTNPLFIFYNSDQQPENPTIGGTLSTTNDDNMICIKWDYNGGLQDINFLDHNDQWQKITSGALLNDKWIYVTITVNSVENITYNVNGTVVYGSPHNISAFQNNKRIDSLYIYNNQALSQDLDFDDHSFVTSYGYPENSGNITINVYNESNPSVAIPDWSMIIYDENGVIHYSADNLNNPVSIGNDVFGDGTFFFSINATGYDTRTYTSDIVMNYDYYLDAFLPWVDSSHLYYIQVNNEYGQNINDANVVISKLLNNTIKEVASGFTNIYGLYPVYLLGGDSYKINISVSGYDALILEDFIADPDNYGLDYPIVFSLAESYISIQNISMDSMVLSPYNTTAMKIRYLNLNYNNSFVNFTIYDVVGNSLLTSYNISSDPDNITILFNFSGYGLVGDILKVIANVYRNDTDHITLVGYFNVEQSRRHVSINSYIAVIFSISICLFGLTIAHPKKTLGPIGIIVIIISIGITAYADQVWFVHLIQAIEIILLLFTILVFKEEGVNAV